jgi:hypothetical protein
MNPPSPKICDRTHLRLQMPPCNKAVIKEINLYQIHLGRSLFVSLFKTHKPGAGFVGFEQRRQDRKFMRIKRRGAFGSASLRKIAGLGVLSFLQLGKCQRIWLKPPDVAHVIVKKHLIVRHIDRIDPHIENFHFLRFRTSLKKPSLCSPVWFISQQTLQGKSPPEPVLPLRIPLVALAALPWRTR